MLIKGWCGLSNLSHYLILQIHSLPTAIHKSSSLPVEEESLSTGKNLGSSETLFKQQKDETQNWQSNKTPRGEIQILNSQAHNLKLSQALKLSIFKLVFVPHG